MGLLKFVPWRFFSNAALEIVKTVREKQREESNNEQISELQAKADKIKVAQDNILIKIRFYEILLFIIFLLSLTALVVSVIALVLRK
jgi:hypothetical protein